MGIGDSVVKRRCIEIVTLDREVTLRHIGEISYEESNSRYCCNCYLPVGV